MQSIFNCIIPSPLQPHAIACHPIFSQNSLLNRYSASRFILAEILRKLKLDWKQQGSTSLHLAFISNTSFLSLTTYFLTNKLKRMKTLIATTKGLSQHYIRTMSNGILAAAMPVLRTASDSHIPHRGLDAIASFGQGGVWWLRTIGHPFAQTERYSTFKINELTLFNCELIFSL